MAGPLSTDLLRSELERFPFGYTPAMEFVKNWDHKRREMSEQRLVAILDFGSQYTQLIARRLRELGVYCEIFRFDISVQELRNKNPYGIILSGGPLSVYDEGAPLRSVAELLPIAPVMGICYGMHMIAREFGGHVESASKREYGFNEISWEKSLHKNIPQHQKVWMSHGDVVEKLPRDFEAMAYSDTGHLAAMKSDRIMALQFHPEVSHTEHGLELLQHFAFDFCKAQKNWSVPQMKEHLVQEIKNKIPPGEKVLCALSGGVDSTVVAVLLSQALGSDRVICLFVDNGLLRLNEYHEVLKNYKNLGLNITGVDASQKFLSALAGVVDPEKKRKIIGHTFIEVFDEFIKTQSVPLQWLAQGTLYPDVIESVSPRGTSVTIKTHHNVGGLPEKMNLKLVEPLRELFKDEVRRLGATLGIESSLLNRHPFPGPGLAVRVLGAITKEDLDILRNADAIFVEELKSKKLYEKIWQAFSVLLPVQSVGVKGDNRSYARVLALRAITSVDGMTADWFSFDANFLGRVSSRITNEVPAIGRVVYDVTSKPPATIEWE